MFFKSIWTNDAIAMASGFAKYWDEISPMSYRDFCLNVMVRFLTFGIEKKNALPTDGCTDRRTDGPSFSDARMHLIRPIRPTMRPHDD